MNKKAYQQTPRDYEIFENMMQDFRNFQDWIVKHPEAAFESYTERVIDEVGIDLFITETERMEVMNLALKESMEAVRRMHHDKLLHPKLFRRVQNIYHAPYSGTIPLEFMDELEWRLTFIRKVMGIKRPVKKIQRPDQNQGEA